ncbi:hypothetical protein SEA_ROBINSPARKLES_124 [Gordonia phage RobinSparkles]|nr:hypothetical protein SEA_ROBINSPARKLES_124 [Gordonia phage RobinSparkles]
MATKYQVNLVKRSQTNTERTMGYHEKLNRCLGIDPERGRRADNYEKRPRHSFAIMGNDRELTPNIVKFEEMLDSIGTNGELLGDEPYSDNGKHRRPAWNAS